MLGVFVLVRRPMAQLSLVLLVSLAMAACSKSPVKLNPVKGQVLFKEKPAEGAQIVFQPEGGVTPEKPMAYGSVGPDGSFALHTDPYGDGAVAGNYVVLFTWNERDPRDEEKVISKLPSKYSDPSAPQLKAEVKEGSNELEPFRLK